MSYLKTKIAIYTFIIDKLKYKTNKKSFNSSVYLLIHKLASEKIESLSKSLDKDIDKLIDNIHKDNL